MPNTIPEIDCDVAVIGGGIAGLSAAITARHAGAETIVIEKAPKLQRGGNSAIADAQIRYPHEPDAYCPTRQTKEDFFDAFMKVSRGRANKDLIHVVVDNAADVVDWLTDLGVQWEKGYPNVAGYRRQPVGGGWQLVDTLYKHLERGGVHVAYETAAEQLLTDRSGRVVGVRVLEPEGYTDIKARGGVVIACGGFEANVEMRVRYLGRFMDNIILRGSRYNTGDGLRMALAIGAQPAGQWGDFHSAVLDARSTPFECGVTAIYIFQLGLFIDEDGERFLDEGEDFRDQTYVKFSKAIMNHKSGVAFNVFDDKVRTEDPEVWKRAIRTSEEPYEANSMRKLAAILQIPPERMERTIREYNAACQSGVFDPLKLDGLSTAGLAVNKTNWARPLDTPPFLAYPVTGGITFTFGGLKANADAQVLHTSGRIIPGLYVAGEPMGELYYYNYMGATSVLRGAVFGRIAGWQAAQSRPA
ncbi:MAG: FAD-dependent tricarballylate dehydrogenase TcuA [Deltaproteobacteria bacterium]|nr:FAD-dependent tricarballylate dehydrogenase TcuA [Deltaproteobacteria bacterium]